MRKIGTFCTSMSNQGGRTNKIKTTNQTFYENKQKHYGSYRKYSLIRIKIYLKSQNFLKIDCTMSENINQAQPNRKSNLNTVIRIENQKVHLRIDSGASI